MADLWAESRARALAAVEPLAYRMRPRRLEEFEGQEHILGPGGLLRRMLEADIITSLILFGPPGTGKTTLAEVIAAYSRRRFERENAASVGVRRIREIVDEAARRLERGGPRTILFLDEIHRFTRAQQDVLLADVERGLITLVGATTENPVFACNAALVSRSTLFRLVPLTREQVVRVLERTIRDQDRGLGRLDVRVEPGALDLWATKCDGDARRALMALELAVTAALRAGATGPIRISVAEAAQSIQQKAPAYDATGDEHYDTISAMIKAVRGSDPDAAIYWIARMLDAGEDPRFIARRLAILASEDVGNADPAAVSLAAATWELVERIGMPECRITLSQCAAYLALAPKSNAAYVAIEEALADVREDRTIPVPATLRDPHQPPLAGGESAGAGYRYAHDEPGAIGTQDYLGVDRRYYRPTERGLEAELARRLEQIRALRERGHA